MMIVSFLLLINYILEAVRSKLTPRDKDPKLEESWDDCFLEELEALEFLGSALVNPKSVQFVPPAFIQRYQAVADVITTYAKTESIKKIIDFGCSELGFFVRAKHLEGIEEYVGVDIDKPLLKEKCVRLFPLTSDHIRKRSAPLKASVFAGSVTDPDIRLKDANVVVAIELIEHMYPNELEDLPYNIFGVIQPELAIFTTPNSDFNVLFPNFHGFRHSDHKFEWSLSQFEEWGKNISVRYPNYKVSFHGIGAGPVETKHLGCCSQMAVFVRSKTPPTPKLQSFQEIYELIYEENYPYSTPEQKLSDLLEYEVYSFLSSVEKTEDFVVGNQREVPVDALYERIKEKCSMEKLLDHLKENNHKVVFINEKATLILPYSPDEDFPNSYSTNGNDSVEDNDELGESSDWDVEILKRDEGGCDVGRSMEGVEWGAYDEKDSCVPVIDVSSEGCDSVNPACSVPCSSYELSNPNATSENASINICDTPKSTGAIPKQPKESTKNDIQEQEECSSSGPEDVSQCLPHLEKDDSLENGSEESLVERLKSMKISGFTSSPQKSSGSSALLKTDKMCSQLLKCSHCSQLYLNRHVCLSKIKTSNVEDSNKFTEVCRIGQNGSTSVHRSHSLGNVNNSNNRNKNFRHSLNIESEETDCDINVVDMELEEGWKVSSVPSLSDTFGSQSRAADSGYPNSVLDMELDLTPEQVDEIITETESSLEEEEDSGDEGRGADRGGVPAAPGGGEPIVFVDNVENGDVANNNRDGEGNNMEGGQGRQQGEVLGWEGLVEEGAEVEPAGGHQPRQPEPLAESEDEALYVSALDASNETLVPEESSSRDETAFDSLLEPNSISGPYNSFQGENLLEESQTEFPQWLLNISTDYEANSSGEHLGPMGDDGSSSVIVIETIEVEAEVVHTVEGDMKAGGDRKTC